MNARQQKFVGTTLTKGTISKDFMWKQWHIALEKLRNTLLSKLCPPDVLAQPQICCVSSTTLRELNMNVQH